MQPNAWIRVDPAGFVHVVYDDHEMGQGSSTGFLMMVCDELEADWSKMVMGAGTHRSVQLGSGEYPPVEARRSAWVGHPSGTRRPRPGRCSGRRPPDRWEVDVSECVAKEHRITMRDGEIPRLRRVGGGGCHSPVPEDPPKKSHEDYWLIGHSTDRLDLPDKVMGKPSSAWTSGFPGMLFASVPRPPAFQGGIRSFDDTAARAVPGSWMSSRSKAGSPLWPPTPGLRSRGGRPWWWTGIRAPSPTRDPKP